MKVHYLEVASGEGGRGGGTDGSRVHSVSKVRKSPGCSHSLMGSPCLHRYRDRSNWCERLDPSGWGCTLFLENRMLLKCGSIKIHHKSVPFFPALHPLQLSFVKYHWSHQLPSRAGIAHVNALTEIYLIVLRKILDSTGNVPQINDIHIHFSNS